MKLQVCLLCAGAFTTLPSLAWASQCPCAANASYCQFSGKSCPFTGTCHGSNVACDCTTCGIDPYGHIDPQCTTCDRAPSPSIPPWDGKYPFDLWVDPPGSAEYKKRKPKWYDLLLTRAGDNFTTSNGNGSKATVHVNMAPHGAIHLFADPAFKQGFDDEIRKFNGVLARNKTGLVDRCGWPNQTAAEALDALQYHRSLEPLHEDFAHGLPNDTWTVARVKGCCDHDATNPSNPYHKNLNIMRDVVNGVEKNVLALTAWNEDDAGTCPGPDCFKNVRSNGAISTAGVYGSGRYEVIAKVADAPGLVWALWTYHYEEHLPSDCHKDTCWCNGMPTVTDMVRAQCELHDTNKPCAYDDLCDNMADGWIPTKPVTPPVLSPAMCGGNHSEDDPQFLGNSSIAGWKTVTNHEIDIEIPANCVGQLNVCNKTAADNVTGTCVGEYNTVNLNNYLYSQNSGTGPAYTNMCVRATTKDADGEEEPLNFIGDLKYHNYTIVWHTGGQPGKTSVPSPAPSPSPSSSSSSSSSDFNREVEGYVDFYIDGYYLGTNNAFVPTRGSKFFIAHWYSTNLNHLWNGKADHWRGGKPGDGKSYSLTTYISEVHITPFDEPNDIMYPSTGDQPDGCTPDYTQAYPSSPDVCHPGWTYVPRGLQRHEEVS